jgi:hypothetical protein
MTMLHGLKGTMPSLVSTPAAPATGFLDVRAAATFLSVSKALLDKLRMTGDGPRFTKAGRKVIYRTDDLLAWAAARSFTSSAEAFAAEGAR